MKAVDFKERTHLTAEEHQDEYETLPVHITPNGELISCWKLSLWERLHVLFAGRIWLFVWTRGEPMQPVALESSSPFEINPQGE